MKYICGNFLGLYIVVICEFNCKTINKAIVLTLNIAIVKLKNVRKLKSTWITVFDSLTLRCCNSRWRKNINCKTSLEIAVIPLNENMVIVKF